MQTVRVMVIPLYYILATKNSSYPKNLVDIACIKVGIMLLFGIQVL